MSSSRLGGLGYAARAGPPPYSTGSTIRSDQANFLAGSVTVAVEVGSFSTNGIGLHDMQCKRTNEWVQDCYVSDYFKAPCSGKGTAGSSSCKRVAHGVIAPLYH
jgi:formylglycine-generating enzyme required for sulfatase activity